MWTIFGVSYSMKVATAFDTPDLSTDDDCDDMLSLAQRVMSHDQQLNDQSDTILQSTTYVSNSLVGSRSDDLLTL